MFAAELVLALIAIASGVGVVMSPQAVHSALFLTLNLLTVALLYLTMNWQFLAAAQLVVYAGAIMVVFLFAVTTLAPDDEVGDRTALGQRLAGLTVAAVLGGALSVAVMLAPLDKARPAPPAVVAASMPSDVPGSELINPAPAPASVAGAPVEEAGALRPFARALFGRYVFVFEGTAFVLLVALIGVVLLGHRRLRSLDRQGREEEVVPGA